LASAPRKRKRKKKKHASEWGEGERFLSQSIELRKKGRDSATKRRETSISGISCSHKDKKKKRKKEKEEELCRSTTWQEGRGGSGKRALVLEREKREEGGDRGKVRHALSYLLERKKKEIGRPWGPAPVSSI